MFGKHGGLEGKALVTLVRLTDRYAAHLTPQGDLVGRKKFFDKRSLIRAFAEPTGPKIPGFDRVGAQLSLSIRSSDHR